MADLRDPPSRLFPVVPNDSNPLPFTTTAIWNGDAAAKDIQITDMFGEVVVLHNCPSGQWTYVRAVVIWNTNTTATNIVAGSSV